MIVIYSQDGTYIKETPESAKNDLISLYGEKLGEEAYMTVKNTSAGVSYRKNGGPLVQVVTDEEAERIRKKETAIGMM